MALMGSVYSIEYPPEFVAFEKLWTGWLGLNVMTEIECYQKISFLMKLRIAVFFPVVMIVRLAKLFLISLGAAQRLNREQIENSLLLLPDHGVDGVSVQH